RRNAKIPAQRQSASRLGNSRPFRRRRAARPVDDPPQQRRAAAASAARRDMSERRGYCPGALRPMLSGDGLLVRLRLSCNEATPELARAIADWAARFGNGALDLSARSNLQMRG